MRHLRKATHAWLSALLVAVAAPAIANDCPSGQTGRSGFVVERGERSTTEVFHLDGAIVRTVMRSGGNALLETTQFQGLLQLDRVDTGRRTTFRPKHQLAAIFPLKTGQQSTAEFEVEGAQGRASIATVVLKVLAKDSLFIGPCRYEILKIERSEGRGERPAATDQYRLLRAGTEARDCEGIQGKRRPAHADQVRSHLSDQALTSRAGIIIACGSRHPAARR